MSDRSEAFESAVGALIAAHTAAEAAPGARARARIDRAFAHLLALAAPRIRYFTRAYGLGDCADDAAQACAIALHRAAERYDPRARALRPMPIGRSAPSFRRCACACMAIRAARVGAAP